MIYSAQFSSIVREEELTEITTFSRGKNYIPYGYTYELKEGYKVFAEYIVGISFTSINKARTEDLSNALRSYFVLYGDSNLSEENLIKYLKYTTNLTVTNLKLNKVLKRYIDGASVKDYDGISELVEVYPNLEKETNINI